MDQHPQAEQHLAELRQLLADSLSYERQVVRIKHPDGTVWSERYGLPVLNWGKRVTAVTFYISHDSPETGNSIGVEVAGNDPDAP